MTASPVLSALVPVCVPTSVEETKTCALISCGQKKSFLSLSFQAKKTLNAPDVTFSHDVTADIGVPKQRNRDHAVEPNQSSPVGVELFSYVNTFSCSDKFACVLAT